MALTAGSIAFTGFNTDGNDNVSFVALQDIAANEFIVFEDNERNTTGTGWVDAAESGYIWTATTAVAAGTIVRLDNFGSGTPAASTGTFVQGASATYGNNRGLANSGETVYAYTGTRAAPTFITAVSNNGTDSNAVGSLAGTGLTYGVNALNLGQRIADGDIYAWKGTRDFASTNQNWADVRAALNATPTAANWDAQDGTGDQSIDATAPNVPFSTTAFAAVCYLRGTRIATPDGERAIEELVAGDEVVTIDGVQRIRWIGFHSYGRAVAGPWCTPIILRAGALREGLPTRDLRVSPWHAILFGDVMLRARDLVNGTTILQAFEGETAHYLNLEFESPTVIYAEGVAAESYANHRNRQGFANFADYQAKFGDDERLMLDAEGKGIRRFPLVLEGPAFQQALALVSTPAIAA